MKSLKMILVACIVCFLCFQANAQKKQKKQEKVDTVGVFCNMQDEIIYMFDNVILSKDDVTYLDTNKKSQLVYQSNIKWMMVYNRIFVCIPLKENGKVLQLMEILAVNDKHILLQYWWEWYYYYIIDHTGKIVEPKIKVFDRGETIGASKNNENVMEIVKEYFGDCPELLKAMKDNFDKKQILSTDIVNIQCGDGMPIMEIIEMLNNKGWYKKKK